jgi:hypothetical protein
VHRLIILSLLLITFHAPAQEFKAGIRFGADGSQVNGDGLEGFNKAGILFGAFVKRDLTEKVSAQMEMVYIQKGSRMPTNDYNQFYLMRLGYIEVPLLAIYHVKKSLGFYAGPSFGVLISDSEQNEWGVFRNRPPFKKYEAAANVGLLWSFSEHWSFDARYSHSITTIRPYTAGPNYFFDQGQYNVLIETSLTYGF